MRQALEGQDRTLGPEHPDTINTVEHLAEFFLDRQRYAAAEKMAVRAVESRKRRNGGPQYPAGLQRLARVYYVQGRITESAAHAREGILGTF